MKKIFTLTILLFGMQDLFAQIPSSGNVLWLKADAAVFSDAGITTATNGQTVQQWNDQSGNGNNVSQITTANKPVFQAVQIGGQPSIFFDGISGTKFLNNTTQNLVAAGGARTTIIVGKISAGAPIGGTLFTYRRSTFINSVSIGSYSGSTYIYSDGVNASNNATVAGAVTDVARNPFIATYTTTSGSKIDLRINTVSQLVNQSTPVTTETGTTGFTVGGREDYPSWWQGLISEVIVYNRTLTPAETQQVESYLQIKYEISCSSQSVTKPGSGNAAYFPGSGSYGAYTPDSEDWNWGSGDFGIECWLNPGGSGQDNCIMTQSVGGAATPGSSSFYFSFNNSYANSMNLGFYTTSGTGWTNVLSSPVNSLVQSKWQHVAVIRKAGVTKMYINGIEQVTTGSVVANIPNGSQPLEMGMQNFNPFLGGWVDEVRIYKGNAPDQTTLRDWMCKKTTASHPYYANMVANYNFDEDAGKTFAADKINCHNLYFLGSAAFVKSGAALGDVSAYDYTNNIATANINFGTPSDDLSATMNAGTSAGVHVYGVNEAAINTQGIATIPGNDKYAGVFVVNGNVSAAYNVVYNYTNNTNVTPAIEPNLKLSKRTDNAGNWSIASSQTLNQGANTITATGQNTEYILSQSVILTAPTCAINLNGTTGAGVTVPHHAALNMTTAYTYEAWIKPSTDISNYRAIINKDAYPNYSPGMYINSSADAAPGKFSAYFNIGGSLQILNSTTSVNDDQWHHVASTYDGTTLKVYVDGILENTLAVSGALINTTGALGIGYNYTSGNYPFIGKMDEVRIWNIARTSTQILTAMNSTLAGNETGLVAYYDLNNGSFNGNGQTITNLCSNTGNILNGYTTGTSANPTFDCPNTMMPALASPTCGIKFNGTSRVDIGNLGTMPNKGTIEFWMNQPAFSDWQIPLSTQPINTASVDGILFQTYATGQLIVAFGNNTGVQSYYSYGNLVANRSYHVAVTWDLTSLTYKGYLDGRLIFIQPLVYYPTTLPRLTMGAGYNNGRYYNGTLDEVRYWNTERTQSEIINNATAITGNETGLQAYYHFNENILNGNAQTVLNKCLATTGSLNGTTVNYVKFPCSLNPPTCGIKLSGAVAESVQVPNNAAINLTGAFTYQTWIKASADISNYRCIFSKGAFATSAPSLMIASAASGSGGKLYGTYYIGSTLFSFVTPTTVNDNEWHHIAFTYDGAAVKLYIDGVLDLQQAAAGVLTTNTGTLAIGYNFATANYPFVGIIDEFSVWNIARTQTDIQNTMNTGFAGNETGLVAYYNFSDNNRSGLNRTITNFCTTTGSVLNGVTYGTALTPLFDCAPPPFTAPECNLLTNGSGDHIIVPNNAALNMNSSFTIAAYLKTTDASGQYKTILAKSIDANNQNYVMYINPAGRVEVDFQRSPIVVGGAQSVVSTSVVIDGNWHYIVGTFDDIADQLKIYVDGVLETTLSTTYSPLTGNFPLYMGSVTGSNNYNGSTDEVSIWNRALSATEVTGLIGQSLVGNETGLVAYYNFNNNHKDGQAQTITNACSNTGSALNGTSVGSSITPVFTCSDISLSAPACAMLFNGNGDKAFVGGTYANTAFAGISQNFTIEIKAKPLVLKGGSSSAQYDGVYSGQRFAIFPDQGGDLYGAGNAGSGISIGTNGIALYEHSTNYMPARIIHNRLIDDWIHVTIVYKNGAASLYENGVLISSASASGFVVHPSSIVSGYYGDYGGYISEIRIWDKSLSSAEVRNNVNANLTGAEANLAALYKFNNTGADGANKTVNSFGSIGSLTANKLITAGSAATPMFTCANNVYANNNLTGAGHMMSSGNYLNSQPYFTEMGNWGVMPNEGTITLWSYYATPTQGVPIAGQNLLSTSNWNIDSLAWRGIRIVTNATGGLDLIVGDDNSNNLGTSNSFTIPTNHQELKWHQLAIGWNKTLNNLTVYLDGIQKLNVSNNKWPSSFSNVKLGTGYSVTSAYNFGGYIDEFTYWNKQLTQAEVRQRISTKITASDVLYSNLQHYYRFDNDYAGGMVQDYKGSRHGMKFFGDNYFWGGTPLGDISSTSFAGNSAAASVNFGNPGNDIITATMNNGNADGIIVYGNNDYANTLLFVNDTIGNNNRYAGVYVINGDATTAYTLVYDYTANPTINPAIEPKLKLFYRTQYYILNTWSQANATIDFTGNTLTTTGQSTQYVLGKNNTVIPVKWISFNAMLNANKQTELQWKVENENGVSNYVIEWSADGNNWQQLAIVHYNAQLMGDYKAIHVQPKQGFNYYRIRQVDMDGRFSLTDIKLVALSEKIHISIYPNPATELINIIGWNDIKQMQLYDIAGRKIKEWQTAQQSILVHNIPAGTYLLKAQLRSGEWVENKIIVNK